MAKVIPSEYTAFKDKLDGKIEPMISKCQDIKSRLNRLSNSGKKAVDGVNQYYKSDNKATVLSSLSSLSTLISTVDSSLSAPLMIMLNTCSSIITNIKRLETINQEIIAQEGLISDEESKKEPSQSVISDARAKITTLSTQFDQLCNEIGSAISEVKGMDTTINIGSSTSAGSTTSELVTASELPADLRAKLKYGKFYRDKFTYNGVSVQYLVYVPDYGQKVDKLPINMYMHGSGTGENSFSRLTSDGLGKFISDKMYKPSGIVVLPLAPTGNTYENKKFRDALAHLPFQVAKDYNGDEKRVSLSGHSWGAITAYRLVNENPGKFTAIVTASGSISTKVLNPDAFKDVKILAFHGTKDAREGSNTNYYQAEQTVKTLKSNGSYVYWHPYKGAGHGGSVITDTFTKEYEIDGKMINPIEYAFMQTRA